VRNIFVEHPLSM